MPSLRTDHVAADNLRRVNYWYRQGSLLPMARVPGFFGHQTDRSRGDLAHPNITMAVCENQTAGGTMSCYKRDYDLLGYRYALMSQLATAGLNIVACMLPARDEQEFRLFPQADVDFIKRWISWTDTHISALRNTVPLPQMDEVGIGYVDGTAAFEWPVVCKNFEEGFVFLFNPGYQTRNASFELSPDALSPWHSCRDDTDDTTSGLARDASTPSFAIVQLYPPPINQSGFAKSAALNDILTIELAGSSALMLRISKASTGSTASHRHHLPPPLRREPFHMSAVQRLDGFGHAAQVQLGRAHSTKDGNVSFTGTTTVPVWVFEQLAARQAAYPVRWDQRDNDASWLRPERLLLFLQLNCSTGRSGACDDTMFAALRVDGSEITALKAYESRCVLCTNVNHPFQPRQSRRFNGYYWDVTTEFAAGVESKVELRIPSVDIEAVQGLFFENVV